jgi:glycogen debranching enzyme
MSATSTPWTFADESPAVAGDTSITLVQGSTFLICDRSGDIDNAHVAGLFVADTRILSTCTLHVMGRTVEPLAAAMPSPFSASIVARSADHRLLVRRELHVGHGLRIDLSLRNLDPTQRTVDIVMTMGADLADVFVVKDGRPTASAAACTVDGRNLRLADTIAKRGAVIRTRDDARIANDGTIAWRVTLAARGDWATCLEVSAVRGDVEIEPTYRCGQPLDAAEPSRRQTTWKAALPILTSDVPGLAEAVGQAADDLGALRIYDPAHPDDAVVAAGAPWFMTLFGRDSILSAWMALPLDQTLGLSTARAVARLQGTATNDLTEEQPGRILHEVRRNAHASLSFADGDIYYGSVDATPLFVMLVAELFRWGVPLQDLADLLPAVDNAIAWLQGPGDADGDGYIEYRRRNSIGLVNQGWKDSWDGISFADGRLPVAPIALAEVQGYAYAAWLGAGALAEAGGATDVARDRRARAAQLKARFNTDFWLEDRKAFAIALDADKQPVDAVASNMGHCLWTGIIDDHHAAEVAAWLVSPELFSGWGIRTLATTMARYDPLSYHNGSVWPHDTAINIAGLLRYGFSTEADQIIAGLLAAAATSGGRLPELFAGLTPHELPVPVPYPSSCSPQAWASAAPLLIARSLLGLEPDLAHQRLIIAPQLPQGRHLNVSALPLAEHRIDITAGHGPVHVQGLPKSIQTNPLSP